MPLTIGKKSMHIISFDTREAIPRNPPLPTLLLNQKQFMIPLLRCLARLIDLLCPLTGRRGDGILLTDYQDLFDIERDVERDLLEAFIVPCFDVVDAGDYWEALC